MSFTRNTVQRQLVLDAVQHLRHHPTAEEIYVHISQQHPSISRATVYRNLALLSQAGDVQRVSHLNAADRFDFELSPHYHFHCEECDGVFDVEYPYKPDLLQEVGPSDGFEFHSYQLTFTGLCPTCAKRRTQKST